MLAHAGLCWLMLALGVYLTFSSFLPNPASLGRLVTSISHGGRVNTTEIDTQYNSEVLACFKELVPAHHYSKCSFYPCVKH